MPYWNSISWKNKVSNHLRCQNHSPISANTIRFVRSKYYPKQILKAFYNLYILYVVRMIIMKTNFNGNVTRKSTPHAPFRTDSSHLGNCFVR